MNPFDAVAKIIVGIYDAKVVQKWVRFLFQLVFSGVVSFMATCGGTLLKTQNWPISIGSGLVVSSVVLTVFFRRSPETKGMMVVLPTEEAVKELNQDVQIIERDK